MQFTMKFRDGSERRRDTEEVSDPLSLGEALAENRAAEFTGDRAALRAEAERAEAATRDPRTEPGAVRLWLGFRNRLAAIADEMERREERHREVQRLAGEKAE